MNEASEIDRPQSLKSGKTEKAIQRGLCQIDISKIYDTITKYVLLFDTHPLLPAGGREDRRKEGEIRMTYEEAFEFLDRTARGIAQMFGSSCETLVHDMSVPDHPILSIYNGHVSGREVGSTMDIMGVGQDLDEEARKTDFVNLYATTPAGQQIKSSTFHMMSDEYNLALGINFDYSSLVFANRILVDLMRAEEDLKSAIWRNGENRLGEILDECLAIVGKPVGALNKADRIKVIALLNQREAFSFRKAVPFISQRLGVSRYTVYKYLSEIAEQKEELHESMEARD